MSTLSERILDAPAGTYVDREVDLAFAHDGTGILAREALREMGVERLAHPERLRLIFDHIVPANTGMAATLQAELREYARTTGVALSDAGGGICHQVLSEGVVRPGTIVAGADSHSCTLGALGAFATGMGATDMAAIWASGATWFRVPETIAVCLSGRLSGAADPKDVALTYAAKLGMEGATYRALEFVGDGVAGISMDGRLTLCNMAVETGAKTGLSTQTVSPSATSQTTGSRHRRRPRRSAVTSRRSISIYRISCPSSQSHTGWTPSVRQRRSRARISIRSSSERAQTAGTTTFSGSQRSSGGGGWRSAPW